MDAYTRDTASPLGERFTGQLLQRGEAGYEDARRLHNGLIDRQPALIARCATTADVVAAVQFARTAGLSITVRGGGHGVAGLAVADGAMMIDLSRMRRIDVDAEARTATAEGGALWSDLDAATQRHGLATTGGVVSTTGVAGLTLGGGWGWLAGTHGLAVDNLLAVDIVTADGHLRTASADEHRDLFWAVRGGGAGLGVVVSFRFRLQPVGPTIVGGLVAHPLAEAPAVLRLHRQVTASAPDELSVSAALLSAPDGTKLVALAGCYVGDLEAGHDAMQALREFGTPVMSTVGPIGYPAMNALLDASFPAGALNYWKSRFLDTLEDDAIATLVGRFATCPSPMSAVVLDHWHGAATRVAPGATAFPHRRVGHSLLMLSQWRDLADTERNVAWTRDTYAAMGPHTLAARYVNFLDRDDLGAGELTEAYGDNQPRLAAVRMTYDPTSLFHANASARPITR
ncbi:MAG TPA: FAD-dependent oxidoreductase [Gemmatimonadaceae bacterium]|nr:FAD-dependent oxidoreductase [Gemmatimonadaceae bacterium]